METERKTTLTLILNEKEIAWLRSVMQNPIFVDDSKDESKTNAEMRNRFWNAIN